MKRIVAAASVLAMAIGMSGPASAIDFDTAFDKTDWPDELRVGVLPEEDQAVMEERYEPFVEHFEEVLGMDVELFFGTDFTAMVEAMRFENIEVSKFGPFSYILAADRANAEAIVQGAQERFQPTYSSYIIVREDSGLETVDDLEGASFGWVDPASTSGYLFPRAHLLDELAHHDVDNDNLDDFLGEVINTGGHDAGVRAVINGDVDAAAVSDSQVMRMERADEPGIDEIMVLTETDPIPRSPEAVRADLPESLKAAIAYAYLSFNDEDFLVDHNYHEGFITVDDADYDVVRNTAEVLGLDPADM